MTKSKGRKKLSFPLIVFAVILLFNTNIGIFDLLPDTIAYLILAGQLKSASKRAPFFAEACDSFKRLALITFLKYPASLLSALSGTTSGRGDMAALFAIIFSAFEIVYLIKAVKYLFDGLYRLGERTNAESLILPFKVAKDTVMAVDTLRFFTYLISVTKCLFQAIPDTFRLTRIAEDGFSVTTISKGYPIAVIMTQLFGLIIGVFWLVIITRYIKAVRIEGRFDSALDEIISPDDRLRLEKKEKLDYLISTLSLLAFTSFFTVEIRFSDSGDINMLPHTLYALLLVAFAVKLMKTVGVRLGLPMVLITALYTVSTAVSYVFETKFLYYDGYDSLKGKAAALENYIPVEILAVIEAVLLAAAIVWSAYLLRKIIFEHTGTALGSSEYTHTDRKYHRSLNIMNVAYAGIGVLFSIFRCLTVFSYSTYRSEIIDRNEITEGAGIASDMIYIPVLEWASPVCSVLFILLIGFTLYYTSSLRDEIKLKYSANGDFEL